LKIVLIRQRFNPFGGAELHLNQLIRALTAEGHQITVVAEAWPQKNKHDPQSPDQDCRLVELGLSSTFRYARLRAFCRAAGNWLEGPGRGRDVAISVDKVPGVDVYWTADGCHAAWLDQRSNYVSAVKRLSFKINPLHRTHLRLEREMLFHPGLKLVMANSMRVRDDLLKFYRLNPNLIRVVPTGVDPDRIVPPDRERAAAEVRAELDLGNNPFLLFVGSGFKRKGLGYAIRAMSLMKNKSAILVAAGKDPARPYLNLARRLNLAGRVRLVGLRADVARLLAAADVFVLPTIYDPGAVSCLESLVAGVPVVTTRTNGSADFIEPGLNGFILERADDLPGLTSALEAALELKPKLVTGQTPIPTMKKHINQILSLLEEIQAG